MESSKNERRGLFLRGLAGEKSSILTRENRVRFYFEGDEAFQEMKEAIEGAEQYVHLEMYMFLSDAVGELIAQALIERARKGISVKVVYDAIGSAEADDAFFQRMLESDINVCVFRPVAPWRRRSGILGRNHRKNLIVDGRIAFTGGMNLGEAWSRAASGADVWRDTHLSIEGPGAAACEVFFQEAWKKAGGSPDDRQGVYSISGKGPGRSDCVVVGGSGFAERRAIRRLYSRAFSYAAKEVDLTVPYFIPPKRMIDKMRDAVSREVKLDILVPKNSDVALADWIREGLYPSLMEDGLHFNEYIGAVLHAKSMVVDNHLAIVGSANFDYLSISLNWELAVVIDDPEVVSLLREQHRKDLELSEKVTWDWAESRPWWRRLMGWIGAGLIRKL